MKYKVELLIAGLNSLRLALSFYLSLNVSSQKWEDGDSQNSILDLGENLSSQSGLSQGYRPSGEGEGST